MTAVEDYNDAMREIRDLRDERDRLRRRVSELEMIVINYRLRHGPVTVDEQITEESK